MTDSEPLLSRRKAKQSYFVYFLVLNNTWNMRPLLDLHLIRLQSSDNWKRSFYCTSEQVLYHTVELGPESLKPDK